MFVVIVVFVFGSFSNVVRADAANGTLTVDKIVPEQTEALAGGGFENGWKWDFYITIPTNENVVSLKFDDWTNGTETIPASNVRYYSASSTNASTSNNAIQVATSSIYADSMGIVVDGPVSATSTQIMVVVEVSVPENIDGGSFSTNYSVQSLAPTSTSISVDKSSLTQTYNGTAKTVGVISSASTTVTYVAVDPQNQLPASSPLPIDAGTYNFTATINDPRYITATTTGQLVIEPAPITITASGTTKEYDATTTSFAVLTATGTSNKDLFTVNAIQSYDSKDVGNRIINISQINIIPQGSNTKLTNYYCGSDVSVTLPQCNIVATTTGIITPVHLTVVASGNGNVPNGNLTNGSDASSYISLNTSISNQINPVFSIDKDIVATSTSAVFVNTATGTYDVDVSGIYLATSTNSGNYYVDNSTTTIRNFPVNGVDLSKMDPAITFNATSTTVNLNDTVIYSSKNPAPIIFSFDNLNATSTTSNMVTFTATGTVTVTAWQQSDNTYSYASTSTTFTIN